MQYVFGRTLICETTEIAEKIAFNPHIQLKCVNLEGDIINPHGTMTGGYVNI